MSFVLDQMHMELRELALQGDEPGFNQLLRITGDVVQDLQDASGTSSLAGEDPWLYQIPWLIEPCEFPISRDGWVRVNWPPEYFDQNMLREFGERVNQLPIGPFPKASLHCLFNTSSKRLPGYNLVWRSDWEIPNNYSGFCWDFLQGFKRNPLVTSP